MISKMMGIFGLDPKDLMTDDEITKLLSATFNKFDKDGSGQLEKPEFHKAWEFLGFDGSVEEVNTAFNGVNSDNSGMVDKNEFMFAVTTSRMADLSLSVIFLKVKWVVNWKD